MAEISVDEILLPNEHVASECWNPHYHKDPFRADLAEIFENWYRKQYSKNDDERVSYKPVPLCIFGGVGFNKDYIEGVEASGTYAACPNCKQVLMCGYNDNTGLGPRNCKKCSAELDLNCYFQSVEILYNLLKPGKIDPQRDPMLAVAELCAIASGGIPFSSLAEVLVIMRYEKLLKTGNLVTVYIEQDSFTFGLELNNKILWVGHKWVDAYDCSSGRKVKVVSQGKKVLRARNVWVLEKAKQRLAEILKMPKNKRYALALRAHANSIENL